ncbi:TPA: hypothetical protein JAN03_24225 [Citrobacter freundii]|nr:hypothetical protein [Citrobacter freundii]
MAKGKRKALTDIYAGLEHARITQDTLAKAIRDVKSMGFSAQEQLIDDIYREQPNMLASVLALQSTGVSFPDMDIALNILMVCFTAMKYSGDSWPLLTKYELERQMNRYRAQMDFTSDSGLELKIQAMTQVVMSHKEPVLLAYVSAEISAWLASKPLSEEGKYVILCAGNFVNCIAALAHTENDNCI